MSETFRHHLETGQQSTNVIEDTSAADAVIDAQRRKEQEAQMKQILDASNSEIALHTSFDMDKPQLTFGSYDKYTNTSDMTNPDFLIDTFKRAREVGFPIHELTKQYDPRPADKFTKDDYDYLTSQPIDHSKDQSQLNFPFIPSGPITPYEVLQETQMTRIGGKGNYKLRTIQTPGIMNGISPSNDNKIS